MIDAEVRLAEYLRKVDAGEVNPSDDDDDDLDDVLDDDGPDIRNLHNMGLTDAQMELLDIAPDAFAELNAALKRG